MEEAGPEAEVEADMERDIESEPELMEERIERSIGNSCSCTEDWSDSTELVLGYLEFMLHIILSVCLCFYPDLAGL